jgi:cyclophilin family peptidyl-prolyl cis-trans isomerase
VNLRGGPGLEHPVVDTLAQGEVLEVIERKGQWLKLDRHGIQGWVFATLVSEPDGPVTEREEEPPVAPPASGPEDEASAPAEPESKAPPPDLPPQARDNMLRTSEGQTVVESYTPGKDYVAVIETSRGSIVVALWAEAAPNHVKNFMRLAGTDFYDGLTFHRVVPGFLIQGGDPRGDGTGGPGYTLALEAASGKPHVAGVLSMARRPAEPDSAVSQFFIVLDDHPWLDGRYTSFGAVIRGMKVVRAIEKQPTNDWDQPVEPVRILDLRVMASEDWEG